MLVAHMRDRNLAIPKDQEYLFRTIKYVARGEYELLEFSESDIRNVQELTHCVRSNPHPNYDCLIALSTIITHYVMKHESYTDK